MFLVERFPPPHRTPRFIYFVIYYLFNSPLPPSGVRDEEVAVFGGHHSADHNFHEVAPSQAWNSAFTYTDLLEAAYALSQSLICGCSSMREAGSAGVILGSGDSAFRRAPLLRRMGEWTLGRGLAISAKFNLDNSPTRQPFHYAISKMGKQPQVK